MCLGISSATLFVGLANIMQYSEITINLAFYILIFVSMFAGGWIIGETHPFYSWLLSLIASTCVFYFSGIY
jgi:hypothetical protein